MGNNCIEQTSLLAYLRHKKLHSLINPGPTKTNLFKSNNYRLSVFFCEERGQSSEAPSGECTRAFRWSQCLHKLKELLLSN